MKQIYSKTFQKKKEISIMLVLVLILGIFPVNVVERIEVKAAESEYGISNPRIDDYGVTTWDCVYFGSYWQADTNGDGIADKNDVKQPIKWRVLSVVGDDAFLLADKNIDVQRYNDTEIDVTWETSTMRRWLNEGGTGYTRSFLDNAFSEKEKSAIQITTVLNGANLEYNVDGGNATLDKVFLLSIDEVLNPAYGFVSYTDGTDTRRAINTAYVACGGEVKESPIGDSGEFDYWWLRSPGIFKYFAAMARTDGGVELEGYCVEQSNAVRPALHLNLNVSFDDGSGPVWSYAGTVDSKGAVTEPTPTLTPTQTQDPDPSPAPTVTPPALNVPKTEKPVTSLSSGRVGTVRDVVLKQKKKTVSVSWKYVTGADGYQLCYATSGKWKGKKWKLTRGNTVVLKKLKKKKTYYIRVRAYRKDGLKKVYGAWCKTKKITVK